MAIDLETFRVRFPVFNKAADLLVQSKLDEATRNCRTDVWGDSMEREDGVFYTAARLLALTPEGRAMRLVSDKGVTIYDDTLKRLQKAVSYGYRLI